MEFRTSAETKTNAKKKCDSTNGYKKDKELWMNQGDQKCL